MPRPITSGSGPGATSAHRFRLIVARKTHVIVGQTPEACWHVVEAAPHPALAPYINQYQGYRGQTSGPMRRRELPMAGFPVIINFGTPFGMVDRETGCRSGERHSFVAGLHDSYVLVDSTGADLCLQVNLSPIGAYRFLQTSMANLADQTIELADVLGYRGRAHHRRSGSVAELGRMFRSTRCPVSSTYRSSARGQPGNHLCLGSATPGARIGSHHRPDRGHRLEPKTHGRPLPRANWRATQTCQPCVRFQRALDLLSAEKSRAIDIAYARGYTDQAHMIKEFQSLAGATPRDLVEMGVEPAVGIVKH